MANTSDIVARLVLNAKNFTAGFDTAINDATARARAGGAQISRAFGDTAGAGLRDFAGQVPVVGGALTSLGGVALVTAAGIGAVSVAAAAALANTEEYAQASRQLEAVLKATGNQTGFTSAQLKEFAEQQESALAISAESILKTEQVLASFDGVAGTTFKRATIAAADLSAVYGGDLAGNAEKLGVVLQNLAQGNVEGLSKGFKFLGTTTLDTIAALAKTGDTAAAQTALLDALEQKIGGAGGAAGQGVAGAFFRLKDAIGDASRAFAEQSGLYDAAVSGLNAAADAASTYADKLTRLNGLQLTGQAFTYLGALLNPGAALGRFAVGRAANAALPDVSFGNSAGFSGFGSTGPSASAAEDAAAKSAANRAKSEADAARAAEAAAVAHKASATAAEAAAKSLDRQKKSLEASVADLEFQAKTAGMSRDEAEKLTKLRSLELQYGKLLSDNDRQRIANAIELRQRTEEQVAARKAEIGDFLGSNGSLLPGLTGAGGSLAPRDLGALLGIKPGSTGATEAGQQFRYLSDAFYDVFSSRSTDIWGKFKDLGLRSVSEIASKLVLTGKFDGGGGGLGGLLGGGTVGAALGIGLPLIGSVIGSIGPTSRGFANLSTTSSGAGISASIKRGSKGGDALNNATGAAQAFLSSLNGIASQFGGSIASGVDLGAIGFSKGTFQLKSTAVSRDGFGGGTTTRFNTAEEAVAAALKQALSRGAITGLDAGIQKLLSTGDLGTQTAKAQLLSQALKELNTNSNPLQAAVDELTGQFEELRDVMIEAGSSSEDLAKASALYDKKLQDIQKSSEQAVTGLRSFLNDLNFGGSSPLSLGDQRSAALANYQAQVGLIGTSGFDQGAFTAAGRSLLDVETQISGRTQDFFSIFNQVQADTNRAISTISNASAITGDNPFARKTADATSATASNTSQMLETLQGLPAAVAAALAGLGVTPGTSVGGGGSRNFVAGNSVRAA